MSQEEIMEANRAARWPELGDEPEPDEEAMAKIKELIGWTENENGGEENPSEGDT